MTIAECFDLAFDSSGEQRKREKTTNLDKNENRQDRSLGGGVGSNSVWVEEVQTEIKSNHEAESSRYNTVSARFSIESTAAAAKLQTARF
jgi:hypothetical protein